MKNQVFWTASLVLLLAALLVGCQKPGVEAANENAANAPVTTSLPVWDTDFLLNAQKTEIQQQSFSRAALDKAYGADVQDYARMVVDDQTRIVQQLTDLMNKKGVSQPGLAPEAKVEGEYKFDSLSGTDFDNKYISFMAADTQQASAQFKRASETSDDREVRAFASAVLPILEREQQKAADIEKRLNKENTK